ncbi:hypothetical protein JCM3770_003545 [Rhodotorula araucariae]
MPAVPAPPTPPPKDHAGVHGCTARPDLGGLTSVTRTLMNSADSIGSGSGGRRSSGGETLAPGPDDDVPDEALSEAALARTRQIAASLSRLEGRSSGAAEEPLHMGCAFPLPDKKDERSSKPSAEFRTRPNASSPTRRTRPAGSTTTSSNRASVATCDSVLTTGESVYEDAKENPDDEGWEDEVMPPLPLSELTQLPVLLDPISLPDRHDVPSTPKADLTQLTVDCQGFSPRSIVEEQATLLQRRASLQAQAQASRRTSVRQSFSATTLINRRNSAMPSLTQVPVATRRSSVGGSAPTSPTRQWYPKPLVLTPTRTIQAPLTSATPTSPSRRHGSAASTDGGGAGFTYSRNNSVISSGGLGRAISPTSERRTPSPRSPPGASGPPRHSLNSHNTSEGILAHARTARRNSVAGPSSQAALSASHRSSRTGSQDTASTGFTGVSLLSRASSGEQVESPDSSVDGWVDAKDAAAASAPSHAPRSSPLLSDGEWEKEYQRRSRIAGPLELVEEAAGSDARTAEQEHAAVLTPPKDEQKTSVIGQNPAVSFTAATPWTTLAHGSLSTISPAQVSLPTAVSQKPLPNPQVARHTAKYDEHWNGESVSDSAAEDSDATSFSHCPLHESLTTPLPDSLPLNNPSRSSLLNGPAAAGDRPRSVTPLKGKPIVIKSMTARSSAVMARRSRRLSLIDPPVSDLGHRPSRTLRRVSATPAPVSASSPPRQHTSALQEPTRSPPSEEHRSPSRGSQPVHQRRMSLPRAHVSPSQTWSGFAIWPPPAETKTVTLAPPLTYVSDGESAAALSGRDSETDDDGFDRRGGARYRSRTSRSSRYTVRRPAFEPRNPRAAPDDQVYGPESWLEVLLNEEPPSRSRRSRAADELDRRWCRYSGSTFETYSARSGASNLTPGKASGGGGLTRKIFGGLVAHDCPKKPISIAPQYGKRRESSKPRPVVSGPLELQAMARQRSLSSTSSVGSLSSLDSVSGHGAVHLARPMVHYPSVAGATADAVQANPSEDAAEELASLHFDSMSDLRASLDSVFHGPPRQHAAPPDLHARDVASSPSPRPRHTRLHSAGSSSKASSPVGSHFPMPSSPYGRSRQGSRDSTSSTTLAFPSASHANWVQRRAPLSSTEQALQIREVLRGQALER